MKLKVKIRVSSKQKDMALFVDKLGNVLRQFLTLPPEVKNDPTVQHIMNQILEASGLSPATLGRITSGLPTPQATEESVKPLQALTKREAVIS